MKKHIPAMLVLILIPCVALSAEPADPAAARQARERMVREQIQARGISRPDVLRAMQSVPRHWFVPEDLTDSAYKDHPLPIGEGQTISQPYIVALMTELLDPQPSMRVLEIGTGSGYQAAILSGLSAQVYTIEIKAKLYQTACKLLEKLPYKNITCLQGDGYFGWPSAAPYDGIMITAAVDHIPAPLIQQLKDGGRLVLPLGSPFGYQNLVRVTKQGDDVTVRSIIGVLFVPLTGHAMEKAR